MTANWIKPTIYLFLSLLGLVMAVFNSIDRNWEAVPQLFFVAFFFVLFLDSAPHNET